MAGAIAILDSGVGGLTVVREIFRQLPLEEVVYVGDSARCPYGSRPSHEIYRYSLQMVRFLLQFQPKALVIACNTITAVLLTELKNYLSIPVIGVIEPGARAAIRITKNKRIGVIGTEGTIRSGSYERALLRTNPDLWITSMACPSLVPLVELGQNKSAEALEIVQKELLPLQGLGMDTLVLGCTHYPIIADLIQQSVGDQVSLISSAEETASELSSVLAHNQQLISDQRIPTHQFYTSGDILSFQRVAENWLQRSLSIQYVELGSIRKVEIK